jgi:hypothetical protein
MMLLIYDAFSTLKLMLSLADAGRPVVQLTALDTSLLRAAPTGLTLPLPNVPKGLRVVHRPNIQVSAELESNAAEISSTTQQRFPTVWVGTVAGSRPGYSAVVLTHDSASNVVRGSVRFWDRRAGGFRVFRVSGVAVLLVPRDRT